MHTLYFVKLKNKENALREAIELLDCNSFSSENGGYWNSSKADWYSIGGRWSGLMTKDTQAYKEAVEVIKPLIQEELKKSPDLLDYLCINPHFIKDEKTRKTIDAVFMDKTGLPYFRDTYDKNGYPDDVFEITKENLPILKKEYGDCEIAITKDGSYIEGEITCKYLTKKDIGEYLVIVDYHS